MDWRRAAVWFVVVAVCCGAVARASEFHAKVIRVLDGDTIEVLHDRVPERIRLNGIDCPEKAQACGSKARQRTDELCWHKEVLIDEHGTDRYGRTIVEVFLPDGRDINEELVAAGLAWWYRKYAPDNAKLQRLEEEARGAKRGLWADPNPVSPWEWRRMEREGVGAPEVVPGGGVR